MRDQCHVLCEKGNKDVEMKWDALLNFKELLNVSFLNWMFTQHSQVHISESGDK